MLPRSDLRRWYCVWSHAQQEQLAEAALRRRGFETFLPLLRPRPKVSLRPAFPRYLFVLFDVEEDPWREIYSTHGVRLLLSSAPTCPTPISHTAIERIQRSLEENAAPHEEVVIRANDQVRVMRGHFQGKTGICTWTSGRRIGLLMSILNVAVDRKDVELVQP